MREHEEDARELAPLELLAGAEPGGVHPVQHLQTAVEGFGVQGLGMRVQPTAQALSAHPCIHPCIGLWMDGGCGCGRELLPGSSSQAPSPDLQNPDLRLALPPRSSTNWVWVEASGYLEASSCSHACKRGFGVWG